VKGPHPGDGAVPLSWLDLVCTRARWPPLVVALGRTGHGPARHSNTREARDVRWGTRIKLTWPRPGVKYQVRKSPTPAAQYGRKYAESKLFVGSELAAVAWLDPSIITKSQKLYI